MSNFAPYIKKYGCFIVRNVTPDRNKTISIFQYPINFNTTRDLLLIPGVSESDIRASLLKGELRHKILAKDIIIECSDIDLVQFNLGQKDFLQNAGVSFGLAVGTPQITSELNSRISTDGYSGGFSEDQHKTLRDLIHFISGGPGDGFASGAERITLPAGDPFPTSITWYLDSSLTTKLVEKLIVYTINQVPDTITWNMYNTAGTSIIHTIVDTFTYVNNVFESSRIRTIS